MDSYGLENPAIDGCLPRFSFSSSSPGTGCFYRYYFSIAANRDYFNELQIV
jgi:hypothetical protein